jgi:GAF domain-containing protein
MSPAPGANVRARRAAAERLAGRLARILGQAAATRRALVEREAELAAGVPILLESRSDDHLADRLAAVLRGGCEMMGCEAAGLYLLDAATRELKLRSCWNLPAERLSEPARPLQQATADLEALLGYAVVVADPVLRQLWRPPEDCAAAVCVPVANRALPLGTLWLFSTRPREFSDRDTQLAEMVAGRIAAELDRQMLVTELLARASRAATSP